MALSGHALPEGRLLASVEIHVLVGQVSSRRAMDAPAAGTVGAGLAPGVRMSELPVRQDVRNEVVGWTGGLAGEGPDDDLDSDTNFSP